MKERIKRRKRTYSFVLKKIKEPGFVNNHRLSKLGNDIDYIPLNDIIGLRDGTSDPSLQLVTSLKKLFPGTANEAEIERYLIHPFTDQSLNHNKVNNS